MFYKGCASLTTACPFLLMHNYGEAGLIKKNNKMTISPT